MIILKNVTKAFGKAKVLTDISFRIDPSECVCVTGPSGAGKSTLVSLLIGAAVPSGGSIEVDGVNLATLPSPILQLFRRRVGIVFQDFKLLEQRTVEENVAFPLEVCAVADAVIHKRVPELLRRMGLWERRHAFPRELSGGEKARAAVARAIVHHPLILLADEPTGNLDPHESLKILELFREIHAEGTTVILATHDSVLVDKLQTRVIRLEAGRMIRDSIGTYEHEKHAARHPEIPHAKHKIFKDADVKATEEPHHRNDKNGRDSHHHKKIKVTSIGS